MTQVSKPLHPVNPHKASPLHRPQTLTKAVSCRHPPPPATDSKSGPGVEPRLPGQRSSPCRHTLLGPLC